MSCAQTVESPQARVPQNEIGFHRHLRIIERCRTLASLLLAQNGHNFPMRSVMKTSSRFCGEIDDFILAKHSFELLQSSLPMVLWIASVYFNPFRLGILRYHPPQ